MYKKKFKRAFDFVFSLIGLLLVSPILLLVWVLLAITNGGSGAFFIQNRPGKYGKLVKVIKFKTMNDKRDNAGNLLPDSCRITSVGKIIRSLSIDELPQLINVVKGDMSLVGPRPLLVQYLPHYSERQARRHEVRPGMTGWAQIKGRNSITWEQKFEHDVWYVDNMSLWLDIRILFLTIKLVFLRNGINESAKMTMKPFEGNKLKN